MSPYAFLLRGLTTWYPTEAQREEARKRLPYFTRRQFVHQLADDRHPEVYTYIRRPGYYAAFNSGAKMRSAQARHFGLGLVWSEAAGAVLQSQESAVAAWGTAAEGARDVYEAGDLNAVFTAAGEAVQPKPGSSDLPAGAFSIAYRLGDRGDKSLQFGDDAIVVTVRHPGAFTESIPLLQRGDQPPAGFAVRFDPAVPSDQAPTETPVGRYRLLVLHLKAKDSLAYRLQFGK
jgi:hypothetical protein